MTRHDDFTAHLEGYLDEYEGLTPLPAAVRDAVRGALPTTKQSGSLRGPLRYLKMTMSLPGPARFAALAAVVAAIAVAGYAFAPRSNVASGPTPRPTASGSASADVLITGPLPAGTYITHPFATENASMSFTFTVPNGWRGRFPWGLERTSGASTPLGDPDQSLGIGFVRAGALFADPCHWRTSAKEAVAVGPHIDDLVEALQAQPMYETSAAANAALGGYTGKKVDIQLPANVDLSTCDDGAYYLWESPTKSVGYNISAQSAGARFHVWILDVQGARVLVVTRDFASTFAVERAELQQIVDSIRIEWND